MTTSFQHRDDEARDPRLDALAEIIQRETEALLKEELPQALARQWEASPTPTVRDESGRTSTGDRPSDPTADTVIDSRRLAIRETVVRAEAVLRDAAASVTAVRRAMRGAVARFDGEA